MGKKKVRNILIFALSFVFIMGIIFVPNLKKLYKENISKKYSNANIEFFDLDLFGATGWAGKDLDLKSSASNDSETLSTVNAGQTFMIMGQSGSYWEITYDNNHGYIDYNYCLINLPDVLTKAKYDIKNAYGSVYRTKNRRGIVELSDYLNIDDVTGEVLYGVDCSNGICEPLDEDGMIINNRLKSEEFIVPTLYSTAQMIAKGASLAKDNGYRIKVYDTYTPFSASKYVYDKFTELYNSSDDVQSIVNYSYDNALNSPDDVVAGQYWRTSAFVPQVNSGTLITDHNVGAGVDVSLCKIQVVDGVETCSDVNTYSPLHQLSTDSIKYTSEDAEKDSTNYTVRIQDELYSDLRKLDSYLQSGAGMTPSASEWWHFTDSVGFGRMANSTENQGINVQLTSIVSDYGFSDRITVKGDANGNGILDSEDAELVYRFYSFLTSSGITCETCGDLIDDLDITGDNQITVDDVYMILNNENDLIKSNEYIFGEDYVDIGSATFSSSNVTLKDIQHLSFQVTNGILLIKYYDSPIKSYNIVSYSYTGHDLSKPYIYVEHIEDDLENAISDNVFVATNAIIELDKENDKVYIKTDDHIVRDFTLVYYTSPIYDLTKYLNSQAATVEELLSDGTNELINCHNCTVFIEKDNYFVPSGTIPEGSMLVLVEDVSGSNEGVKSVPIRFAVLGIELDITSADIGVGEHKKLTATIIPDHATNQSVAWSSSDESIVRVNSDGKITGISTGTATISAKSTSDNNIVATCNVTVTQKNTATYIMGSGSDDHLVYYYEEGNDVIGGFNALEHLYSDGKKLIGWEYDGQTYELHDTLEMPSNDIELTAIWEEISDGVSSDYDITRISDNNGVVKIITNINLNTNVTDINLGLDASQYIVTIHGPNGNDFKTGILGTGDIIKVWVGDKVVDKYEISIKGDSDGDGNADIVDITNICKYIKRLAQFSNAQINAMDVNSDGDIDIADITIICKYIKHIQQDYLQ